MPNEILFFLFFLLVASTLLVCLRLGKTYLFAAIAALATLINIFVLKPFTLFGITTYGSNILYGCIFLATDLIAEHYGKKEALKGVGIGFLALFIYFISSIFYLSLPVDTSVEGALSIQSAFETIFTPAFAIVFSSLLAFLISNTFDIHAYEWIHKRTGNKLLWLRNNASTWVSQLLDSIIFYGIGTVLGVFDPAFLLEIIAVAYVFKIGVASFDTPFIYLSKVIMKGREKKE